MTTFPVPILFLVFNRPQKTAAVLEAIRRVRPAKLYIAADGPRQGHPDDCRSIAEVRSLCERVDWPCETKTLFRSSNLGCRNAVTEALSWFFASEDKGIILEDDCVPTESFFFFCSELLDKYYEDQRVLTIAGTRFLPCESETIFSYYASKHFRCWGWATWRRAWKHLDLRLTDLDRPLEIGLRLMSDGNALFRPYWLGVLARCRVPNSTSWAYPFSLACFARAGDGLDTFHLAPSVNLIRNIGFDGAATHSRGGLQGICLDADEISFPLKHPPLLSRSVISDQLIDRQVYGLTLPRQIKAWAGRRFPFLRKVRTLLARKRLKNLGGA